MHAITNDANQAATDICAVQLLHFINLCDKGWHMARYLSNVTSITINTDAKYQVYINRPLNAFGK